MPHDHRNPHLMYLGFKQGTCNFLFHATCLWKPPSQVFRLQTGNLNFCFHATWLWKSEVFRLQTGTCNFCFHATHGETPMYLDWKQKPVTFASTPHESETHIFRLEKGNLQFCFQLHACEKPPSHIFRLEKGNLLPCHTTVRNPHLMLLGLKTRNL